MLPALKGIELVELLTMVLLDMLDEEAELNTSEVDDMVLLEEDIATLDDDPAAELVLADADADAVEEEAADEVMVAVAWY